MNDNELVPCPRCNYESPGMRECLLCRGVDPCRHVPASLAVEYSLVRGSPDFALNTLRHLRRLRERHGLNK